MYKENFNQRKETSWKETTFTARVEHAPLEAIYIYIDTATYNEIERDVKVTTEAQLGLIGGTMGLLTGFSLLSGVEIIYYLVRFFLSLRISRDDLVAAAKSKFEEPPDEKSLTSK